MRNFLLLLVAIAGIGKLALEAYKYFNKKDTEQPPIVIHVPVQQPPQVIYQEPIIYTQTPQQVEQSQEQVQEPIQETPTYTKPQQAYYQQQQEHDYTPVRWSSNDCNCPSNQPDNYNISNSSYITTSASSDGWKNERKLSDLRLRQRAPVGVNNGYVYPQQTTLYYNDNSGVYVNSGSSTVIMDGSGMQVTSPGSTVIMNSSGMQIQSGGTTVTMNNSGITTTTNQPSTRRSW